MFHRSRLTGTGTKPASQESSLSMESAAIGRPVFSFYFFPRYWLLYIVKYIVKFIVKYFNLFPLVSWHGTWYPSFHKEAPKGHVCRCGSMLLGAKKQYRRMRALLRTTRNVGRETPYCFFRGRAAAHRSQVLEPR